MKKLEIVGARVWSVRVTARDVRRQLQSMTFYLLADDFQTAGRGAVQLFKADWASDHHARTTARAVTVEHEGTLDGDVRVSDKRPAQRAQSAKKRASVKRHRDATGIRLARGSRAHKGAERLVAGKHRRAR